MARGFTLVELLIVLAVAGVLAAVAVPSFQSQLAKGRRADGIAALMRLELAQARYHANNGFYAQDLQALGVSAGSLDGHYRLALASAGRNDYRASAVPAPESPQARGDAACAPLTLSLRGEQATRGPSLACWNR